MKFFIVADELGNDIIICILNVDPIFEKLERTELNQIFL